MIPVDTDEPPWRRRPGIMQGASVTTVCEVSHLLEFYARVGDKAVPSRHDRRDIVR